MCKMGGKSIPARRAGQDDCIMMVGGLFFRTPASYLCTARPTAAALCRREVLNGSTSRSRISFDTLSESRREGLL